MTNQSVTDYSSRESRSSAVCGYSPRDGGLSTWTPVDAKNMSPTFCWLLSVATQPAEDPPDGTPSPPTARPSSEPSSQMLKVLGDLRHLPIFSGEVPQTLEKLFYAACMQVPSIQSLSQNLPEFVAFQGKSLRFLQRGDANKGECSACCRSRSRTTP